MSPTLTTEWKESIFVGTISAVAALEGLHSPTMDEPAKQAFVEMIAKSMTNVTVQDIEVILVFEPESPEENPENTEVLTVILYTTQFTTHNVSTIPGTVVKLLNESISYLNANADMLSSELVTRSVELGSVTMTSSDVPLRLLVGGQQGDVMIEEVQTFAPTSLPTLAPSLAEEWIEAVFVVRFPSFTGIIGMTMAMFSGDTKNNTEDDSKGQIYAFEEVILESMNSNNGTTVTFHTFGDILEQNYTSGDFESVQPILFVNYVLEFTTTNVSSIPATVTALSNESHTVFATEGESLASKYVTRSIELGSTTIPPTIAFQFLPPEVTGNFTIAEQVQTFPPTSSPTTPRPTGIPSVAPTSSPSRGELRLVMRVHVFGVLCCVLMDVSLICRE